MGFCLTSSTTMVVLNLSTSSNVLAPSEDTPHCCRSKAKKRCHHTVVTVQLSSLKFKTEYKYERKTY